MTIVFVRRFVPTAMTCFVLASAFVSGEAFAASTSNETFDSFGNFEDYDDLEDYGDYENYEDYDEDDGYVRKVGVLRLEKDDLDVFCKFEDGILTGVCSVSESVSPALVDSEIVGVPPMSIGLSAGDDVFVAFESLVFAIGENPLMGYSDYDYCGLREYRMGDGENKVMFCERDRTVESVGVFSEDPSSRSCGMVSGDVAIVCGSTVEELLADGWKIADPYDVDETDDEAIGIVLLDDDGNVELDYDYRDEFSGD